MPLSLNKDKFKEQSFRMSLEILTTTYQDHSPNKAIDLLKLSVKRVKNAALPATSPTAVASEPTLREVSFVSFGSSIEVRATMSIN